MRATFLYGTRAHVPDAMVMTDGTVYRLVTDHLGSVRLVVNAATGELVQRMDYDAFGRVLQDTNPGFQPFGFAGGLYDDDTGLVRFGARDYEAHSGRWTAKDPVLFRGSGANLYRYAANDPVNLIDSTGAIPLALTAAAGAVIGAAYGALNASASGGDVATGALKGAVVGAAIGSGAAFFGGLAAASGLGVGGQAAAGALGGFIGGTNGSLHAQLLLEGEVDWTEVGLAGLLGLGVGAADVGLVAYSALVGYSGTANVLAIEAGIGICGGTADILFTTVSDELQQ